MGNRISHFFASQKDFFAILAFTIVFLIALVSGYVVENLAHSYPHREKDFLTSTMLNTVSTIRSVLGISDNRYDLFPTLSEGEEAMPTNIPLPTIEQKPNPTVQAISPTSILEPTPQEYRQRQMVALKPTGSFTPLASGMLEMVMKEAYDSGMVDFVLSGDLIALVPERVYKVWVCHGIRTDCATSDAPVIKTDSMGNASFSDLVILHDQRKYPVKVVKVYEAVGNPEDASSCVHVGRDSTACVGGNVLFN